MKFWALIFRLFIAVMASLQLAGCGGGSGSDGGDKYSIDVNTSEVNLSLFYHEPISEAAEIVVTFNGDGVLLGVPPEMYIPAWLRISPAQNVGSNKVKFVVNAEPNYTYMELGQHEATLRFVTGKADGSAIVYKDVVVRLNIKDSLSAEKYELSFSAVKSSKATTESTVQLNTQLATTTWKITEKPSWITASTSEGQGSQTLALHPNDTNIEPGIHIGRITVTASTGSAVHLDVKLSLKARAVYAGKTGVSFVALNGIRKIDGIIEMFDTAAVENADWRISSNQPWLQIGAITGNRINISANESSVADGLHYATVTIESTIDNLLANEKITVGFYKSNQRATSGELTVLRTKDDPEGFLGDIAIDPVRPYIYVQKTESTTIKAYNIFTGQLVKDLASVPNQKFASIAISGNGQTLYALSNLGQRLYKLDLSTETWTFVEHKAQSVQTTTMKEIRLDGKPMLFIDKTLSLLDVNSGKLLNNPNSLYPFSYQPVTIVMGNQKVMYGAETGLSSTHVFRYEMDYDPFNEKAEFTQQGTSVLDNRNVDDIAVSADGTRLFAQTRVGDILPFFQYSAETGLTLGGSLPFLRHAATLELASNGNIYAGFRDRHYYQNSIYIMSPNGQILSSYTLPGTDDPLHGNIGLKISSDGSRLLALSENYYNDPIHLSGFDAF